MTFYEPFLFLFVLLFPASQGYFKCDFTRDGLCDYEEVGEIHNDFRWQIHGDMTGPSAYSANTYSDPEALDGSFLYIAPREGTDTGDYLMTATLVSPRKYLFPKDRCLKFKYRMFGPHVGSLKINLAPMDDVKTDLGKNYVKLFEKSGSQGQSWHQVQVSWDKPHYLKRRRLVIEATLEPNVQGEIALADIELAQGACFEEDGVACSFEGGSCGWTNFEASGTGSTSWQVTGATSSGPQADHTSGSQYGQFAVAHLDPGAFMGVDILSPSRDGLTLEKGHDRCLSFYYYLGEGAEIEAQMSFEVGVSEVWTRKTTDLTGQWLRGEATLYSYDEDFVISFYAAPQPNVAGGTFVAIDDVNVRDGACTQTGNNDFEHGLGSYETSGSGHFDWIVASSKGFKGVSLKDHTFETTTGHYALAFFKGMKEGFKARLISPTFSRNEVSCIDFKFHFSSDKAGTLDVHYAQHDKGKGEHKIVATKSNLEASSYGVRWNTHTIKLEDEPENFEIIFEATVGSDDSGFIAIDDILVTDLSCVDSPVDWSPPQPARVASEFDCDFEEDTLCKWELMKGSDFDLEVSKADRQKVQWDPTADHSGKADGSVLLTPSTGSLKGGIASPLLPGKSDGHCLSFWYYIHGRGVSMQVLTAVKGQKDQTLVWQRPIQEGLDWQFAEITIDSTDELQILIRIQKVSTVGTAGIDEILYSPTGCSDKKINLADICDFETGLCGLEESSKSEESWTLSTDQSFETAEGPDGDYTYKSQKGHFLLFDQKSAASGSKAIQSTPSLQAGDDKSKGNQICLKFHYYMSGDDVGSLEVTMLPDKKHTEAAVWRAIGDHGKRWIPAEAQVSVEKDSQVEVDFIAVAGDGPSGIIGIDDITFRQGKCDSPGSCSFHEYDTCGWSTYYDDYWPAWFVHKTGASDYGLLFEPSSITKGYTHDMVSGQFDGGQVRCIHFQYAHEAGSGRLYLLTVPIENEKEDNKHMLWQMIHSEDKVSNQMLPARVSVHSSVAYDIRISGESFSSDYTLTIDNIMITEQPCLAEPAEAVSFDCDFKDGTTCFWYQDAEADYRWMVPKGESFAYLEPAFKRQKAVGRLVSPLIPAGEKCLTFSSLRFGADVGYFKVLMDVGHKSVTYLNWRGGQDDNDWVKHSLDLTTDDNFQVWFEGMCRAGSDCDIGITDVKISSSPCPDTWQQGSQNPHCTFETTSDPLCQWTVTESKDLAGYTWRREGGLNSTDPEAPTTDYTFGAAGHFAYVAPVSKQKVKNAWTTLKSPTLRSRKDAPYCMVFAYYMTRSLSGTLNVYQEKPGIDEKNYGDPVWSTAVSDNQWRKASVTLEQTDTFEVIFEARSSKKLATKGLAIDEIFLQKGPCRKWKDVCDFSDDLCLWTNVNDHTDAFNWGRYKTELVDGQGPLEDHTNNGYFLLASTYFAGEWENAKLLSAMHNPSDNTNGMCLQFYYFMGGQGSAVLKVQIVRGFEKSKDPETYLTLWELETADTKKMKWLKATVKLDDFLTVPFKLAFEVSFRDSDVSVAIDDVEIQLKGCEMTPKEAISLASVLADASCSFDSGNDSMCGWENTVKGVHVPQWELEEYTIATTRGSGFSQDGKYLEVFVPFYHEYMAELASPSLPPTDGVECLRFWFYKDSFWDNSLRVQMAVKGSKLTIWTTVQTGSYKWTEAFVDIHNTESFQLYFQANENGGFFLDDIDLFPGSCPKQDKCLTYYTQCGYSQDDTDDYDWLLQNVEGRYEYGLAPDAKGHLTDETARMLSPIYAGGGPQCLEFNYYKPKGEAGQLNVYTRDVGTGKLGPQLWTLPSLKTLHEYMYTNVRLPILETNPFQIVFEHKVGVVDREGPTVYDMLLLSHPCQPAGSCDFEDGLCAYESKDWLHYCPDAGTSGQRAKGSLYPLVDHTYGVNTGYFAAVTLRAGQFDEIVSPILPKTTISCLTFAYSLYSSGSLEVFFDVDGVGRMSVFKATESTVQGQVVTWKESEIEIKAGELFVVIFLADNRNQNKTSYISLDDVKISPGSCKSQKSSKKSSPPEILTDFSCDFEDKSNKLCNYKVGRKDQGSWKRSRANSEIGFDHTREDEKGAFASLVSESGADHAESELEVMVELPIEPGCLSFWYHMAGHAYNTLRVLVKGDSPQWEKTNQENVVWQHALVDLGLKQPGGAASKKKKNTNLYAFKFVGVVMENDGHVALDDIQVYTGSCPKTDICEFEDDGVCDFNQNNKDDFHWKRKRAGDILDDKTRVALTDHTYGTGQGHFMFCCSQKQDEPVTMLSPVYEANEEGRCLIFWARSSYSVVEVHLRDREGHQTSLEIIGLTSDWMAYHIDIRSRTDFQVVFTKHKSDSLDTAIDDVQVTSGPCHELYNCDFTMGFCTWTQEADGNAAWQISSGLPTPGQVSVGPKFDHTAESVAGQYILLQGREESKVPDQTTLWSTNIVGVESNALCFSFWYHMSDASAGALSVTTTGGSQSWGPFNHGEKGWLHEMMTVPVDLQNGGMQVSLVATVEPGEDNYIAVDDLELIGVPCVQVQHEKTFSCRDQDQNTLAYEKVCDFVTDCQNGADEKDCGSCSFEDSTCRFVDTSDGVDGWERAEADTTLQTGPKASADGFFLHLLQGEGVLETSNSFKAAAPYCKLQFNLFITDTGDALDVFIRSHMETTKIKEFRWVTSDWALQEVFIGAVNVPFQIVFIGIELSTQTLGVGIDNIGMVDCGFPAPETKKTCMSDDFHCDNKACIADYKVCDLHNDCGDSSDEKECDQFIRDDFEYSLGHWANEQLDGEEGKWIHSGTPVGQLNSDHTLGSFAHGGLIYCDTGNPFSFWAIPAKVLYCQLASPLLAASNNKQKSCQIHFHFMNNDDTKHSINMYTRAKDSDALEEVTITFVEEGIWNRARATFNVDTEFQIILKGTVHPDDFLFNLNVFLAVDDISLTDGCQISIDVAGPVDPGTTVPEAPEPEVHIDPPVPVVYPTPDDKKDESTDKKESGKQEGTESGKKVTKENPEKSQDDTDESPDKKESGKQGGTESGKKVTKETPEKGQADTESETDEKQPDAPTEQDSSEKVTEDKPKGSQGSWQLPVGLTLGFVALGLIVLFVVIYRRRTNRMFSHVNRPVSYVNEMFNQDDDYQEMTATTYQSNA